MSRPLGEKEKYLYDSPSHYVVEASYAEPGSRPAFRTSYEDMAVPGRRGSFRSPVQRRPIVGERYTNYVSDTIPIYQKRDPDGTHIVISADGTRPLDHPLAEIVTAVATKKGIENTHIEGLFERSKELLAVERRDNWLNDHGKVLAKDTENIVNSLERLFLHKNKDGALQHMISEAAISAKKSAGMLRTKGLPTSALATTTTTMAGTFRELAISMLRSGELRDIFTESLNLFRDVMRKRSKTGGAATPSVMNTTQTLGAQPQRVVRTEYEVKNINQQPFVERTIITETFQSVSPVSTAVPVATYRAPSAQEASFTDRSIGLLRRFGAKPEFKRAVLDTIKIIDNINANLDAMRDPSHIPLDTTHSAAALKHAKTLFASFAGEQDARQFQTEFYSLLKDIRSQPEMAGFFSQLRGFVINSVERPESLDDPNTRRQLDGIVSTGQRLLQRPEWKTKFRSNITMARRMLSNVQRDTDLTDIGSKVQVFLKDFALNNEGKPDLWVMNDSITQLKLILVPLLRGHLDNIPIDRIEMISPSLDLVLEDIMLSVSAIAPSHMQFEVKNKMDMNLEDVALQYTTHTLKLAINRINPIFKNVRFYFRNKKGFKYEDYGLADVGMRDAGMSIFISWKLKSAAGLPPAVYLSKVAVTINDLYVRVGKAKHSFIDKLITSLFLGTIKKRMAAAIAQYLQVKITQVDDQVNYFFAHRPLDKVIGRADMALKSASQRATTSALAAEKDKKKKVYRESKGLVQPTLTSTLRETLTKGLRSVVGVGAATTQAPSQAPSQAPPTASYDEYVPPVPTTYYVPVTGGTTYVSPYPATTYPMTTGATSYVSRTTTIPATTGGVPPVPTSVPSSIATGLASSVPSYATPQTATYVPGYSGPVEQVPRYATYTAIPKTTSGSFAPATTVYREEQPAQPMETRSVRFAETQKQSV